MHLVGSVDLTEANRLAIYRKPGETLRFSYPAEHPLAAEFEADVRS